MLKESIDDDDEDDDTENLTAEAKGNFSESTGWIHLDNGVISNKGAR